MPAIVFVGIFEHRTGHDKQQGWQHGRLTARDRYDLDRLENCNKHEVDIRCLRALLEEIYWEERQESVHAGTHNVVMDLWILPAQLFKIPLVQGNSPRGRLFGEPKRFLDRIEALRHALRNTCHFI